MNSDQKWIIKHFLEELHSMNFAEDEPLYKVETRNKHAEMVIDDFPGDSPLDAALRALAETVSDPVFSPRDFEELTIYHGVLLKALAAALNLE